MDFQGAFDSLVDYNHFYSEALRGQLRTYQLHYEDAWEHYDKAGELAERAENNALNLRWKFFLAVYAFYNALAERRIGSAGKLPPPAIPDLPAGMLSEYPELRAVIQSRQHAEAILRLHTDEPALSVAIYRSLIAEEKGPLLIDNAFARLGLAAALHNLGDFDDARRNLENAGLILQATGTTLSRARAAALLNGFYLYLEEPTEARDWLLFLERLPCPQVSQELFKRRAARVLERCVAEKCLLPM